MVFFEKIYLKLKLFFEALFFSMKGVDTIMTTNQKNLDSSGFEISDNGFDNVYKDILEEKITQRVQELRYSSYVVPNESKKYRYIGNGNAVKKKNTQLTEKHGKIEESDNLQIILIQDNNLICEDVLSILKEVNNKDNKNHFSNYTIKLKRKIFPRFLIEKYVKKIVLKQAEGNYVIDMYCSKYPSQFNERKDKPFLSELKKLKNKEIKYSDIIDFEEINFVTNNSWGVDDWMYYSLTDFEFYNVLEFDGNYILRFGCQNKSINLLDKIYSESAEQKYKIKAIKENAVIDISSYSKNNDNSITNKINLYDLENVKFSVDNNK